MYLYRVKQLRAISSSLPSPRINLAPYIEFLRFPPSIDPEQRGQIKQVVDDAPIAVADLLAATVFRIYNSDLVDRSAFVRECLRCCNYILENEGFDIVVDDGELLKIAHGARHSLVLAPGCQTDELLRSRVRAAEQVCYQLASIAQPVRLFFSGKNPGYRVGVPPSILNESKTMVTFFWDLWSDRQKADDLRRLLRVEPLIEAASTSSAQNIKQVLALSAKELGESSTVFVVSSTFHLIRLGRALEDELKAGESMNVPNVILVGSEVDASSVSMLKVYVKSMLFELFRYLILAPEFW